MNAPRAPPSVGGPNISSKSVPTQPIMTRRWSSPEVSPAENETSAKSLLPSRCVAVEDKYGRTAPVGSSRVRRPAYELGSTPGFMVACPSASARRGPAWSESRSASNASLTAAPRIGAARGVCMKSKSLSRSPSTLCVSRTSGRGSGRPSLESMRWPDRKMSSASLMYASVERTSWSMKVLAKGDKTSPGVRTPYPFASTVGGTTWS